MTMVGVGKGRGRGDAGLPWTDKRCDALRKLMVDGLSASQIARELGGVTRNGVIGKIHRLGLSGRKLAARMHQLFNDRRAQELASVTKPQPAPDTSPFACTIVDLGSVAERTRCRFPLTDVSAEMEYCGAPCAGSWCARHRAIVFAPMPPRRRA